MARINLLPWRAERRKQRQKEFMTMLAGAVFGGIALVLLVNGYFGQQIDGQTARNEFLKARIAEVVAQNKEIEELEARKASLLKRKEIIETLQADRSQNVRLFEELVRTIPDGVRLVTIRQNGKELTLTGRSQSESRVSAYMRNLEASGVINSPKLNIIRAGSATGTPQAATSAAEDRALPFGFEMIVRLPENAEGEGDSVETSTISTHGAESAHTAASSPRAS